MSGFMSSSIGKKFFMSITGLFLMVFLLVHLTANLALLFGPEAFNKVSHFMGTNPIIQVMQPVLAIGFILHILYASMLTIQNQKARPESYAKTVNGHQSSWTSKNMYILGGVVLSFLVLHIINFFWKMKVTGSPLLNEVEVDGEMMENAYGLVVGLFKDPQLGIVYSLVYILGAVGLGFHLTHGFWSSFQTIGMSNDLWRKRLTAVGYLFALLIGAGFSIIPLFLMITA
ncbi:MAG: succinate dehydrogenase cytochrome b subunit [Bacteroidales bacterium]|nr:succinate dehydrogenase cytochrome b subunit [Bacteroidales bacterium]